MKSTHILVFLVFYCVFALAANTTSKKQSIRLSHDVTAPPFNSEIQNAKDFHFKLYHINKSDSLEKGISLRQRRGPCACLSLNCGCCAGMEIQKFKRKLCTNLTYDPNEFQIQLDVMNNNNIIYQNMFSAKNPPPMCLPVPYTSAQMCIKLFNIFMPGRNLHVCMDIETKIQEKPYLVLHFDCMRMGQDGFTLLKPEENGGVVGTAGGGGGGGGGGSGGLFGGSGLFSGGLFNRPTRPPMESIVTEVPQVDTDVFDPITEIKLKP